MEQTPIASSEWQATLAEIEASFRLVRAATRLRPRLGQMTRWEDLGREQREILSSFINQKETSEDVIYRALYTSLYGAFEEQCRSIVREAAGRIELICVEYSRFPINIIKQNAICSGRVLSRMESPPDHYTVDYDRLQRNLGSCVATSKMVNLNPEVFALVIESVTPKQLEAAFGRIGIKINWDLVGKRSRMRLICETPHPRATAKAIHNSLIELVRTRNRIAHTGVGGLTITPDKLEWTMKFLDELTTGLRDQVATEIAAMEVKGHGAES